KNIKLEQFFEQQWQRGFSEYPENASYNGDMRYNTQWTDLSLSAIAQREAADRAALKALHGFDRASLSVSDQLNYDTFEWQLNQKIARQAFREYLIPINHQDGVQTADDITVDGIVEVLPFTSVKDYQDWLARLDALPVVIDQIIILMQEGINTGIMPSKVLMERAGKQISKQANTKPEESPFYKPFQKYPEGFSAQQKASLSTQALKIIAEKIQPAYAKLNHFFYQDYLPKSRTGISVSDLPNGKKYYDFLAQYYTTTPLTANEIHDLGLSEVARIRAKMEAVKTEAGFKGSLPEFFTFLRTDPQFFYSSSAQLLEAYQAMSKRIDPELVKSFHVLPRLTYGIRQIPDNIAPDTTTAYYQPGATDGSRAGFYYVNLYKPEVRPKWEMMALSLHEAVPGHHFQFARALELPDMPMFRRTAYFVAYGEGWGLYAEQLGYDMGVYTNAYDKFGQLTYEMWRAVRLVVDTGMHAKGWSRQQAIDYFKANAPKTDQDIVNEIDRYIGTPGQALAYKIGQLKISELRARAEKAIGTSFDLKAFNDEVLSTGSVPLNTLEKHIDHWIAQQKHAK
ncbi:MAG TPA: DUF885 domain-containing protein, partial [Arenimonas sp.]|nr:DUF885 domain-containing protein [Arenimonas sp.]